MKVAILAHEVSHHAIPDFFRGHCILKGTRLRVPFCFLKT
jgi:hypothetical protein